MDTDDPGFYKEKHDATPNLIVELLATDLPRGYDVTDLHEKSQPCLKGWLFVLLISE
jgi:hypothetical protein